MRSSALPTVLAPPLLVAVLLLPPPHDTAEPARARSIATLSPLSHVPRSDLGGDGARGGGVTAAQPAFAAAAAAEGGICAVGAALSEDAELMLVLMLIADGCMGSMAVALPGVAALAMPYSPPPTEVLPPHSRISGPPADPLNTGLAVFHS